MPKKSAAGKKTAAGKDDKKKKAPSRPTRCGPDFEWAARPRLVEAAAAGDVDRCRKLLAAGDDPNTGARGPHLLAASRGGLLTQSATATAAAAGLSWTALHFAVGRGKLEVVELLMTAGADPHTAVHGGEYFVAKPEDPAKGKSEVPVAGWAVAGSFPKVLPLTVSVCPPVPARAGRGRQAQERQGQGQQEWVGQEEEEEVTARVSTATAYQA